MLPTASGKRPISIAGAAKASGLELAGPEHEALRWRHAEYFAELAHAAESGFRSSAQVPWLRLVGRNQNDFVGAFDWLMAVAGGESAGARERAMDLALRLGGGLGWYWQLLGFTEAGRIRLSAAVAAPAAARQGADRARALFAAGYLTWATGLLGSTIGVRDRAMPFFQESRTAFEHAGDAAGVAYATWGIGLATEDWHGRWSMLERSLALFRALGDEWGTVLPLAHMGTMLSRTNLWDRAQGLFEEALALSERTGNTRGAAGALRALGECLASAGDHVGARRRLARALAIQDGAGLRAAAVSTTLELGRLSAAQGELLEARGHFARALVGARRVGSRRWVREALRGLASVAAADKQPQRAGRLMAAATAPWKDVDTRETRELTAEMERASTPPKRGAVRRTGAAAQRGAVGSRPAALSRREREIADLINQGLTNREIALALVLSERTVYHHVAHILTKLGVRSRSMVASWVASGGLTK